MTFTAVVRIHRYRSAVQTRDGADSVERLERMIDAQAKHIREMDKVSLEP